MTLRHLALRRLFKVLAAAKKKCVHCERYSGALKAEGGCTLFCEPTSAGKQALVKEQAEVDEAAEHIAALAATAAGEGDEGPADGASSSRSSESGGDDSGDIDRGNGPEDQVEVEMEGASNTVLDTGSTRKLLTPLEAVRHMELLWEKEGALLRRVFSQFSASSFFMKVGPLAPPIAQPGFRGRPHRRVLQRGTLFACDQLHRLPRPCPSEWTACLWFPRLDSLDSIHCAHRSFRFRPTAFARHQRLARASTSMPQT